MYHNSGLEALKGCGGCILQASNGKLTVHVAMPYHPEGAWADSVYIDYTYWLCS